MHSPPHPPQSPTDKALEDALEAANLVLGAIDMLLQYQASAKGVMMQPFVVPDYFLGSLLRLKLVAQTFKDTPNAPALNIAAYFSPLPETPDIDANSELGLFISQCRTHWTGFCSLIRKVYSNLPLPPIMQQHGQNTSPRTQPCFARDLLHTADSPSQCSITLFENSGI
ncbi:hypothetical protein PTI98_011701 [Pleurotus ostreatus]|nr:hypothetical protein PTI98_011701 [Pleurotus ostreatus]